MCGRFITTGTWAEYRKYLTILPAEVDRRNGPEPNYNTAPTTTLEIITNRDGEIGIEPVVWGFVPFWAKDAKFKPINATIEKLAEGSGFFKAGFEHHRCLIPATGFYEWTGKKGDKQPWLIHLPGEAPLFEPYGFAGIMAHNKQLDMTTFAIITMPPTDNIAHIHNRMPVILKPDVLEDWMDKGTSKEDALGLLQQNRGADLDFYPVSKDVGSVKNKGSELIEPVA
ncbi:SOS response-associated peptidase [Nitratireductor sp. XY-223]|uniref:SOS response-associated peptidase n=1 Tax=Nitratireductor sp. XY-223 TaxID=2561926 RepID=UPI0010A9C6AC|nr:SOS response-associated peptidase [Nitratireductor sp. XY-223]